MTCSCVPAGIIASKHRRLVAEIVLKIKPPHNETSLALPNSSQPKTKSPGERSGAQGRHVARIPAMTLVKRFGGMTPMTKVAQRLVCSECGGRGVDMSAIPNL